MLSSVHLDKCAHCSGKVVDMGDEFVCSSCGVVVPKEVIETVERRPSAVDYTNYSLGSFLGPSEYGPEDKEKGFSKSSSSFKYLKTISDYSQDDSAGVYPCTKLMERICEKLALPNGIIGQSVKIAKELLEIRKEREGFTIAAICAFWIISACKIYGVTSVGLKEVVEAHMDLGYRVKPSAIVRLSFDSSAKPGPRKAEEYLGRVAAHLSEMLPGLGAPPGYEKKLLCVGAEALRMLDSSERGGHNPCALAATGIYAAEVMISRSEGRRRLFTQKEAATCVNVAEYTVREQFCELFRPRIEEMCERVRPLLQSLEQSSQSPRSPPRLLVPPV
jgi:transcription initiation factor TFIIIB Brf1 subunit/transcription initiation factor TFIIB